MGAPEKSRANNNSMQCVKVYRLGDNGKWDDQGTGHVTVDYLERFEELALFVLDEDDSETILLHRISCDDIYRKQEDTIISWRDPEYNTELALSFQETSGCSYIWDHICSVQRNMQFNTLNTVKNPAPVQTMLTHPEIKRTYDQIMSRVVSIMQEELVSLQARLLGRGNIDEGDEKVQDVKSSSESEDDEYVLSSEDEGGDIRKREDDEVQSISVDEGSEEEVGGVHAMRDKEEVETKGKEKAQLRKSTRVKKPAIGSLWVTTMAKKRSQDEKDKEVLYQMCTTRCNSAEDEQEKFVDMYDYFLTRGELYYLRPRGWISKRRDCIVNILRRVKPEVYDKRQEIPKEVIWAKVHVQADTDSCGVHVLSWLHSWDGSTHDKAGYTMPKLGDHQIRQVKVDCLWWLFAHEQNKHAQKVLSLLNGSQQMKRKKVV